MRYPSRLLSRPLLLIRPHVGHSCPTASSRQKSLLCLVSPAIVLRFLTALLIACHWSLNCAAQDSLSQETPSNQLRALIATHCLECHQGSTPAGGLDLSHRAAVQRGGDSGKLWDLELPLDAQTEQSLITQRVRDREMPPDSQLTDEVIEQLVTLLNRPELWPDEPIDLFTQSTQSRAGYDWWSLQPLARFEPPEASVDHSQHPIDRFVVQKLTARGLAPAPLASPRDQVRRLYADLVGLPPDLETLQAFEANPSDEAWLALVNRLLASPDYAPRWAQHWLDVVRFGETQGFEYNEPRDHAWHYRDWVVRALDSDLPYDRFVQMQLAGDLLEPNSIDGYAATGFLVAGIHNTVVGQSEAMRRSARHAELEELAATTAQAFLGLTVHCARCHDHKFDPIRTEEYYQFIASLNTLSHGTRNAPQHLDPATLEAKRSERERLWRSYLEHAREAGATLSASANQLTLRDAMINVNEPDHEYEVQFEIAPTVFANLDQRTQANDGIRIELLRPDGSVLAHHAAVSVSWPDQPDSISFERHRFKYQGDGSGALRLRISSLTHENRFGGAVDRLSVEGANGEVLFLESFDDLIPQQASNQQAQTKAIVHWGMRSERWDAAGLNPIHAVERNAGDYAVQLFGGVLDQVPPANTADLQQLWQAIASLDNELKDVTIYTAVPSAASIMHVCRRGDPMQPDAAVAPGGLQAIAAVSANFDLPPDATDEQRRRALAAWMTDANNGPFHRTIVNRVWYYHFGQGIVATPNDLGWAGGQPSHPELLDWLAIWFQEQNYSLKQLHRLIVTSHVYRQSSVADSQVAAEAQQYDHDNRLLWRQNPRRLDAESLRDSLLHLSGILIRTSSGPGYRDVRIENVGAAHYYRPFDADGPEFARRSLYRWRVRADRNPLLEAFDCPEPSTSAPTRGLTTTPTQALALWNDPQVLRAAERVAARIAADKQLTVQEQTEHAWQLILLRAPDETELQLGAELVATHGLAALCRVLFNRTEFVVLD